MTPDTPTAPTPAPERVGSHDERRRAAEAMNMCACDEPLIRCGDRGCNCQICGRSERNEHVVDMRVHRETAAALARSDAAAGVAEGLREAYERLRRVANGNVGFPECVEAERAFVLTAYEAVGAMIATAPQPPAPEVAAEPVAYMVDCGRDDVRFWRAGRRAEAEGCAREFGRAVKRLYTAPQPLAPWPLLKDILFIAKKDSLALSERLSDIKSIVQANLDKKPVAPASGDAVRAMQAIVDECELQVPTPRGFYRIPTSMVRALRAALARIEPSPAPAENGEG